MAAADYTTTAVLKTALGITGSDRDTELGLCVTAASRAIDRLTRRRDGDFAAQTLTRYFAPERGDLLRVPPLQSITTLKTDENEDGTFEVTWSVSGSYRDYLLWPLNGPPYTKIEVDKANGRYEFPVGQKTVEIAGSWGLAATVPGDIARACIILATRLSNRAKTPEGIMGNTEAGLMRIAQVDPDVMALVAPYIDVAALVS
jgi:hypothetical protein